MLKNIKELSDLQLIRRIKNHQCSDSFEVLIDRYDKVYYDCCQKFHKKYTESSLQDLLDDIYIVFNQSINTYNIDKGTKFSTWLSYMSRFHCLNSNRNKGQTLTFENKDIDLINESHNRYDVFNDNVQDMNKHILHLLSKMNDKRIPKLYHLRFIEGAKRGDKVMSWQEVGKHLNLSVSACVNLYNKSKKYLHTVLNSNHPH